MPRKLPYALVARFFGAVLLIAATLKLHGLAVGPIAAMGVFSAAEIRLATIEMEFILGLWLVWGAWPRSSWLAAFFTFSTFSIISFYQVWVGESSCGCFGKFSLSPWVTLLGDVLALACLAVSRPQPAPGSANRSDGWSQAVLRLISVCAAIAGLLAMTAAIGMAAFGSVDEGLAHLRGEHLSVSPTMVNVASGEPGAVRRIEVELVNRTDRPIRIFGANVNCSCTIATDLPLVVPPKSTKAFSLVVRFGEKPGMVMGTARLLTQDDGFRIVQIQWTGIVTQSRP
jgi:hypothetical protein